MSVMVFLVSPPLTRDRESRVVGNAKIREQSSRDQRHPSNMHPRMNLPVKAKVHGAQFSRRNPGVKVGHRSCGNLHSLMSVVIGSDKREGETERTAAPANEQFTRGFGPLKTALSAVHPTYKVRSPTIARDSSLMNNYLQEITPIGNKIEDLIARVTALEQRFDSRPRDVEEQRCRSEVILYVVVSPVAFRTEL